MSQNLSLKLKVTQLGLNDPQLSLSEIKELNSCCPLITSDRKQLKSTLRLWLKMETHQFSSLSWVKIQSVASHLIELRSSLALFMRVSQRKLIQITSRAQYSRTTITSPPSSAGKRKLSQSIVTRFEPKRGLIPPKSEIRVYFQTTLYYGGVVEELFICNVEDLEIPLGFEIKADQFGLNVSHQDAQDQAANMTKKYKSAMKDSMNQTNTSLKSVVTTYSDIQSKTGVASNFMGMLGFILMNKLQKELERKQLMSLTFANCKINKPQTRSVFLRISREQKLISSLKVLPSNQLVMWPHKKRARSRRPLKGKKDLEPLMTLQIAALIKVEAKGLNRMESRFDLLKLPNHQTQWEL